MSDNTVPTGTNWSARRLATKKAICRALVEHIRAGTTDMAPGPMQNDARVYTDPERFAVEKRELFGKQPVVAGLSGDLPEPGSVMVFEDVGPSILITRDEMGRVHAFVNRCTHRGAKLVRGCDRRRLVSCPFHGWGFGLNGDLVAVPGEDGFEGLDKAAHALKRVPCKEWGGFIFVEVTPRDGDIDIEAFLGPFAPELAQLEVHKAVPIRSGVLPVRSNWKFALDTYGEGYHFAVLHASTIGQTHYSNIAHYEQFGRHHRINFPEKAMVNLADIPEDNWNLDDSLGAVHYLFPNTIVFTGSIEPGKGYLQLFRLFPGDTPGETVTRFSMYAPSGVFNESYRQEIYGAYDAVASVVQDEDYLIAAEGWANVASAEPGFKVVYGANEIALQNQHRTLAEAIGMPLDMYG